MEEINNANRKFINMDRSRSISNGFDGNLEKNPIGNAARISVNASITNADIAPHINSGRRSCNLDRISIFILIANGALSGGAKRRTEQRMVRRP